MSSEAKAVLASWAADKVKALEFGIRVALDEWQILTLAVEHRWGGQDSKLRAQYLYEDLCDWFTKAKQTIKCHQVEDLLFEVMQDDFQVEAEDGSVERTSNLLLQLRKDVLSAKFDGLLALWKRHKKREGKKIQVIAQAEADKVDPNLLEQIDEEHKNIHSKAEDPPELVVVNGEGTDEKKKIIEKGEAEEGGKGEGTMLLEEAKVKYTYLYV
ncbi:hypothetical protein AAMO2058_000010500 [Amorphochlora amoebiformis]